MQRLALPDTGYSGRDCHQFRVVGNRLESKAGGGKRTSMTAGYSWTFTVSMLTGLAWSLAWIIQDPPAAWANLVMVVCCYLITDLLGGMLHVVLDNPRSPDVAFIKPLAEGFQAHHDDQTGIFKMPLYDHPYVMHMPLAIFFVCTLPLHSSLVYVAYISMAAMLHVMQMSHRWAHMPAGALHPVARGLQRSRLLIRENEHGEHHHPPYQRNFYIMTGMFNRINQALQIDMEDGVMPAFEARGLDVGALKKPDAS